MLSESSLHIIQDPTFWVAFVTIVFMILAFKPIKNALVGILDSRISDIKETLEEANRLKDEAKEILAQAERKLSKSEEDTKEIVSHAKEGSRNIIANTKSKLEKDVENRKKLAMQKIQSFEDNAVAEIKKSISGITIMSAQTVLEENIDDENFQSLVDSSLEKISKTIH